MIGPCGSSTLEATTMMRSSHKPPPPLHPSVQQFRCNPGGKSDNPQKRGGAGPPSPHVRVRVEMFARRVEVDMPRKDPGTGRPWEWAALARAVIEATRSQLPPDVTTLKLISPQGSTTADHCQRILMKGQDMVARVILQGTPPPQAPREEAGRGDTFPLRESKRRQHKGAPTLRRYRTYRKALEGARTKKRDGSIRLTTWNMGGWKAQSLTLRELARRRRGQCIYLLQETHLRQLQHKRARMQMNELGMGLHAGHPTPWVRNKKGLRPDAGRCPGVACVFDRSIKIYPIAPKTKGGQQAYEAGRLQLLQMPVTGGNALIANIYSPAGNSKKRERESYFNMIHEELAAHNSRSCIIGGDYNEAPDKNLLATRLCPMGWRIPPLKDGRGKTRATYRSGTSASWLDGFLVGPGIPPPQKTQRVDWRQTTQHARVTIRVPAMREERWPQVRPPPRLQFTRERDEQNKPSEYLRMTLQERYSQLSTGRLEQQSLVDEAWAQLESAYKQDLAHQVTAHECHRLGHVDLDWMPS